MRKRDKVELGIGIACLGLGAYFYVRRKAEEAERQAEAYRQAKEVGEKVEKPTSVHQLGKENRIVRNGKMEGIRQRPGEADHDLHYPLFKKYFGTLNKEEEERFVHSYLTIKRSIAYRNNEHDFNCKMAQFTQALCYALEVKLDKSHPDRKGLAETARIIQEEVVKLVETPTKAYLEATEEIERSLLRGEGSEIYEYKCS